MKNGNFFQKYADSPSELGTTKFCGPGLTPNPAPPPAPPFLVNPGTRGQNLKMIDVSCDDEFAMPVTVSVRAEYSTDPINGGDAVGGPLVGTLQWGVGGGYNELEFDVPVARAPNQLAPAGDSLHSPMTQLGSGVTIFLAGASHVSLYVRNDASLCPLTNPTSPLPTHVIGFAASAKILAFIAPGGTGNRPLERSIVCSTGFDPLAVNASVLVTIPPFAKSMRVSRNNGTLVTQPLRLNFIGPGSNGLSVVNLGANDEGQVPVCAQAVTVEITNIGADVVNYMQAIFDVTPT